MVPIGTHMYSCAVAVPNNMRESEVRLEFQETGIHTHSVSVMNYIHEKSLDFQVEVWYDTGQALYIVVQ